MSREASVREPRALTAPNQPGHAPSRALLRAAVSGLLASAAGACGDDSGDDHSHSEEMLSDSELTALCQDKIDDAVDKARAEQDVEMLCAERVKDAQDMGQAMVRAAENECSDKMAEAKDDCDDTVEALETKCAPLLLTAEERTINSEQKNYTFEEVTEMCDERGGYTQVHAACGGHNACAGFSFADWGPDAATLTEHSCAGVNACNGLSCVVLPEDEDRTGEEVYEMEFPDPGPGACTNCHAVAGEEHGDEPDASKFKVWVMPNATPERTADNWLDRTAAEQERVVAFGAHSVMANGTHYDGMAPYHRFLSRAEIERVVAHIRTLEPIIETIKIEDP